MNRLLLIALTAAAVSCKKEPASPDAAQTDPSRQEAPVAPVAPRNTAPWPPLPAAGFIHGRSATSADLAAGNAVFVGPARGVPLDIEVPQYAEWTDPGKANEKASLRRVFVIQAETINGTPMLGLRDVESGAMSAALLTEVRLHGTKPQ
jgi:hypothetical protein